MKKIELNKKIYNINLVDHAVYDFKDLCSITVYENVKYIECEFSNCIYDESITSKEFENYLIDCMNI